MGNIKNTLNFSNEHIFTYQREVNYLILLLINLHRNQKSHDLYKDVGGVFYNVSKQGKLPCYSV